MRLSEFWTLMDDELGASYARSVARDLALDTLDGRTADEALEAGIPARQVWIAVCDALDVPTERRHGKDRHRRKPG